MVCCRLGFEDAEAGRVFYGIFMYYLCVTCLAASHQKRHKRWRCEDLQEAHLQDHIQLDIWNSTLATVAASYCQAGTRFLP